MYLRSQFSMFSEPGIKGILHLNILVLKFYFKLYLLIKQGHDYLTLCKMFLNAYLEFFDFFSKKILKKKLGILFTDA